MKLYVQYGCGWSAPPTWRNFDASATLRFEKVPIFGRMYTKNSRRFPSNVEYGDIVKGLPINRNSCDAIFASHILEHLALDDLKIALAHTYKLLKPGGVFRLIVPDLRVYAEAYLYSSDPLAAHRFMQDTYLGMSFRPRGLLGLMNMWLAKSQHLWMWDYSSLKHELINSGFVNIRQCAFGDSSDLLYKDVEDSERFVNSVAIEARKPD